MDPMNDRTRGDVIFAQSQVGFSNFVVRPFFNTINNIFDISEILKQLEINKKYWSDLVIMKKYEKPRNSFNFKKISVKRRSKRRDNSVKLYFEGSIGDVLRQGEESEKKTV